MFVQQQVAMGGSGSTYIYGYLDSTFRENMTKEECFKFVADGMYTVHVHTFWEF